MRPVVEFERVIGVRDVLLRVLFDFFVGVDPVENLRALALVFCHRRLISRLSRALLCRVFSSNAALSLSPAKYLAR